MHKIRKLFLINRLRDFRLCTLDSPLAVHKILRHGRSQANKVQLRQRDEALGKRRIEQDLPALPRGFRGNDLADIFLLRRLRQQIERRARCACHHVATFIHQVLKVGFQVS